MRNGVWAAGLLAWVALSWACPMEVVVPEPGGEPSTPELRREKPGDAFADGNRPPELRERLPEPRFEEPPEKPQEGAVEKALRFGVERLGSYIAGAHGVAVDPKGNIYMADTYGRLRAGVKAVYRLAPPYTGSPVLAPSLKAVAPAGMLWHKEHLYLCDVQGSRVYQFDASLKPTKSWQAQTPWNIDIDSKGQMFIVSYGGSVQQLREGLPARLVFFGLQNPFDLGVLDDGRIWVSEQGPSGAAPGRITLRSSTGQLLQQITYSWSNPEGLAVAPDGAVWVAETGRGELLRITPDGKVQVVADMLAYPVNLSLFANGDILLATVGGNTGQPLLYRIAPQAP